MTGAGAGGKDEVAEGTEVAGNASNVEAEGRVR